MKQIRQILSVLSMSVMTWMATSCATVTSGKTATVTLEGNIDEPLTIVSSHGTYQDVTLPAMVEVNRRHLKGQHIQISSARHAFPDIVIEKTVNPWVIGSVLCSEVSIVVDLLTNAVSKPKYNLFHLSCEDSLHLSDSLPCNDTVRVMASKKKHSHVLTGRYRRHEIGAGVGCGSNQAYHDMKKMVDGCTAQYNLVPIGECFDVIGNSYLFANLEYHYRLNRRWDVGARVVWGASQDSYEDYDRNSNDHTWNNGEHVCRYFVAAPSVMFTWMEDDYIRFYSGVTLGAMRHHLTFDHKLFSQGGSQIDYDHPLVFDRYDRVRWRAAYQLTAVGVNMGKGSLRLFGELGYGCLGIANFGFRVSF